MADPNAVYTELSLFDASNTTEWVATNAPIAYIQPSFYRGRSQQNNVYSFIAGGTIQKTFTVPVDISTFKQLAFWYYSQVYSGRFLTLGIGQNAPNEFTHQIQVKVANGWGQDTWDIAGIPLATLQSIKYITITCGKSPSTQAPILVEFDEMVARRSTILEAIYRDVVYLLDKKLTIQINNIPILIPAVQRTPEFFKNQTPGYLVHVFPPSFDNVTQGRVDNGKNRSELITYNSFYAYKMTDSRTAYSVKMQIDIYSKYEQVELIMQEYLLKAIKPRGALRVAGDLIDCLYIGEQNLDVAGEEQRYFRKIFEYELWTWDDPDSYIVPAVKTVSPSYSNYDSISIVDTGTTILVTGP